MNKLLIGIAIGFLLGLLGYFFLNVFSSNERISKEFARVTIKNEYTLNIDSAKYYLKKSKFPLKNNLGVIRSTICIDHKLFDSIRFLCILRYRPLFLIGRSLKRYRNMLNHFLWFQIAKLSCGFIC